MYTLCRHHQNVAHALGCWHGTLQKGSSFKYWEHMPSMNLEMRILNVSLLELSMDVNTGFTVFMSGVL